MIKQLLHISIALILSAVISIESIGFYITKDICEPCGSSNLEVDLLKPMVIENHAQDNHCCTPEQDHSDCCHNTSCNHNEEKHNHHQENYYLSYSPDFFERSITPEINLQILAVILPLVTQYDLNEAIICTHYSDISIPLPDALDSYRSRLCTYLI